MLPTLTWLRSRRMLFVASILPALLLRASIPAGFMPMFDARGGLTLELCPGTVESGAAIDPHAHHHHSLSDHAGHVHGKDSAASHGQICPFALSAGPALASTFNVETVSDALVPYSAVESPRHHHTSIERAQSARGPPNSHWI